MILSATTPDWEPVWGAHELLRDCDHSVIIGVGFLQENPALLSLETGAHEFGGVTFAIPKFDVRALVENQMNEGVVRITEVEPKVSGHLEGFGQADLGIARSDPPEPTDQTVRVEAFAFRDL